MVKLYNQFTENITTLLKEQSKTRPIAILEIDRMILIIQKKLSKIQIFLKHTICQNVLLFKNRYSDARLIEICLN